jgi:hypothetical protein
MCPLVPFVYSGRGLKRVPLKPVGLGIYTLEIFRRVIRLSIIVPVELENEAALDGLGAAVETTAIVVLVQETTLGAGKRVLLLKLGPC